MFGLDVIEKMNSKAAIAASRGQKQPRVPTLSEIDDFPPIPFPQLGSHVPAGWERLDDVMWFVDSSGCGRSNETALTVTEFVAALRGYAQENPSHGYAVVDAGQFQVRVGAYRPVPASTAWKRGRHAT